MDIRERIMLIRKESRFTQQCFADTIGVSVGVIANIELGRAPVTRVVGIAICSKFHVREQWLFEGTGDMYQADDLLETIAERLEMNSKQRALFYAFADLAPDEADLFYAVAQRVAAGAPVESALPAPTAAELPPYVPPEDLQQKKLG